VHVVGAIKISALNRIVCDYVGASAKLRKATISFVMSARSSVRPHGTTQLPLDGFSRNFKCIFRKSVDKIQVSLKSDKNKVVDKLEAPI
jgi:hypothetical protein